MFAGKLHNKYLHSSISSLDKSRKKKRQKQILPLLPVWDNAISSLLLSTCLFPLPERQREKLSQLLPKKNWRKKKYQFI